MKCQELKQKVLKIGQGQDNGRRTACDRLLRTDFRDISTDGSSLISREVIAKCFWHNRIIITKGSSKQRSDLCHATSNGFRKGRKICSILQNEVIWILKYCFLK